ncbi:MAG TPA: DUF6328 family protein [Chthoniobacterales bacterium]
MDWAVFNNGFEQLTSPEKILHLGALALVATAVALIMTPASYHRIAEKGVVSRHFVEIGSRLLALAMLPLMLGVSADIFIVARLIIKDIRVCLALTVLMVILFVTLWYVFPWIERRLRLATRVQRTEFDKGGR